MLSSAKLGIATALSSTAGTLRFEAMRRVFRRHRREASSPTSRVRTYNVVDVTLGRAGSFLGVTPDITALSIKQLSDEDAMRKWE